jgi:hypothetical protein
MFHAGSFKHSVTSSHLLSLAKSPLFATPESSGLPSFSSLEWPILDWNHSPRTLHTLDGTQTHVTHAIHAAIAAQRFVVVDFYGLRLDICTTWRGGVWDPVATLSLPTGAATRHNPSAGNITHISQQLCAELEDFTVSLQTMASHDACTSCSIDVQCPSGMHAALSMVSADVLVDCMHALHASAMLPHQSLPVNMDMTHTSLNPQLGASIVNHALPVATDNFDGAETDSEVERSGSAAAAEASGASAKLPRWPQVAKAFDGLQEVEVHYFRTLLPFCMHAFVYKGTPLADFDGNQRRHVFFLLAR